MSAELLDWGLRASLALAVAIALVLALRAPWRRWLGARSVPWLWLGVPAALLARAGWRVRPKERLGFRHDRLRTQPRQMHRRTEPVPQAQW